MPKCELKEWKIGEPQVVWISKNGKERFIVNFSNTKRQLIFQVKINDDIDDIWVDSNIGAIFELAEILGIPETIEEEEG